MHSAAGWLLQRMGHAEEIRDLENQLISDGPVNGRDWYQNSLGDTLIVFRNPKEFRMGSKNSEPERQTGESYHRRHIPRDFAISTTEVTLENFRRMIDASPSMSYGHDDKYGTGPDSAAFGVSWYDAVRFCRWLSEQENIPEDQMCYPPIDQIQDDEGGVLRLPDDYLTRTGYRLPTEAEWEYACRGGTITSRYFGNDQRLCGRYAWSLENALDRVQAVGSLKPNRPGMFDMYGNVWEWCQDRRGRYPVDDPSILVSDIAVHIESGNDGPDRILRGGSILNRTEVLRSAQRDWSDSRSQRNHNVGFRVARTIVFVE